jgi:hypothetical protein
MGRISVFFHRSDLHGFLQLGDGVLFSLSLKDLFDFEF